VSNNIGDEGARAIGEALKKNNSLASLDLSIFYSCLLLNHKFNSWQ